MNQVPALMSGSQERPVTATRRHPHSVISAIKRATEHATGGPPVKPPSYQTTHTHGAESNKEGARVGTRAGGEHNVLANQERTAA